MIVQLYFCDLVGALQSEVFPLRFYAQSFLIISDAVHPHKRCRYNLNLSVNRNDLPFYFNIVFQFDNL